MNTFAFQIMLDKLQDPSPASFNLMPSSLHVSNFETVGALGQLLRYTTVSLGIITPP